jgi:hypothetical protein
MTINLQAQGLWHAVDPFDSEEIEYRDDKLALATILRAVSLEMLRFLSTKRTTQSALEAIETVRVGTRLVQVGNEQLFRWEFANARFKDGENVEDFSIRLTGLTNSRVTQHLPQGDHLQSRECCWRDR